MSNFPRLFFIVLLSVIFNTPGAAQFPALDLHNLREVTVATLPACLVDGALIRVSDGADAVDCSTGLGSAKATCRCRVGTGWESLYASIGGGGSSFSNSAELAALLDDETGSGLAVFNNTPTLISPLVATSSTSTLTIRSTTSGGSSMLEVGTGGTGNRTSSVDLVGDATYTDFASRFIRYNTGENAITELRHRGTGAFQLVAQDAAPVSFYTSNTIRGIFSSSGNFGVGDATPDKLVDIEGTVRAALFEVDEGLTPESCTGDLYGLYVAGGIWKKCTNGTATDLDTGGASADFLGNYTTANTVEVSSDAITLPAAGGAVIVDGESDLDDDVDTVTCTAGTSGIIQSESAARVITFLNSGLELFAGEDIVHDETEDITAWICPGGTFKAIGVKNNSGPPHLMTVDGGSALSSATTIPTGSDIIKTLIHANDCNALVGYQDGRDIPRGVFCVQESPVALYQCQATTVDNSCDTPGEWVDLMNGIVITGPTITDPVMSTTSYFDFSEMTPPSDPGSDIGRFYAKDDGGTTKVCFRDSGGTETCIGDGGGGSGDSIEVNASAVTDANFITNAWVTPSLNTGPSPDQIQFLFSYTATLAGNPGFAANACAFSNEGGRGCFICEGDTNNTFEHLFCFDDVADSGDSTNYIPLGDSAGNSLTSNALAANGGNCSSGLLAGGVDASGVAEDCTDVLTEAELDAIAELQAQIADATLLTTADEGSGNGIDADTVDGVEATGFIASTGDTGTGTYDFGGADSFEIPNGTNPTVNAAGELAEDTTDGQIISGASGLPVAQPVKSACIVIEALAAADDDFPMPVSSGQDIVLISAFGHCQGTCTTEADISFEYVEVGGAGPTVTDVTGSVDLEDYVTSDSPTTLSGNVNITALDVLRFDVDNAVSPETDTYSICVNYRLGRT